MSNPEDRIAVNSLDARLIAWKAERAQLQNAADRIAELDALIAFAEDEERRMFKVAPLETQEEVARTAEGRR